MPTQPILLRLAAVALVLTSAASPALANGVLVDGPSDMGIWGDSEYPDILSLETEWSPHPNSRGLDAILVTVLFDSADFDPRSTRLDLYFDVDSDPTTGELWPQWPSIYPPDTVMMGIDLHAWVNPGEEPTTGIRRGDLYSCCPKLEVLPDGYRLWMWRQDFELAAPDGLPRVSVDLRVESSRGGGRDYVPNFSLPPAEASEVAAPLLLVHGWCDQPRSWLDMLSNLRGINPTDYGASAAVYFDGQVTRESSSPTEWGLNIAKGDSPLPTCPSPPCPRAKNVYIVRFQNNDLTGTGVVDPMNVNDVPIERQAYQLAEVIDAVRNETGAAKVDIVAHSMGGLVARSYLQGLAYEGGQSKPYRGDVRRLLTLNSPHQGSDWSAVTWHPTLEKCNREPSTTKAQMWPSSDLLRDLNESSIPAEVTARSVVVVYEGDIGDNGDQVVSAESQDLTRIYSCRPNVSSFYEYVSRDERPEGVSGHSTLHHLPRGAGLIDDFLWSLIERTICLDLQPEAPETVGGPRTTTGPVVVEISSTSQPGRAATAPCRVAASAVSSRGEVLATATVEAGETTARLGRVSEAGWHLELMSMGCSVNVSVSVSEEVTPRCRGECLAGDRFRIGMSWEAPDGTTGAGRWVPLTADTGYMWFFDRENVESVVKVLEGCVLNDHFWVFAAGLTNVKTLLRVTDTETGEDLFFLNPQGSAFRPLQATSAFASCGSAGAAWMSDDSATERAEHAEERIRLNDGRFEVSATWRDFHDRTGTALGVPITGDTGYFWFFDRENIEVVIKVLDGRLVNDHFWVFAAGLTNVSVTITVRDTWTGQTKEYRNGLGSAFQPVQDTTAFGGGGATEIELTYDDGEMDLGLTYLEPLPTVGSMVTAMGTADPATLQSLAICWTRDQTTSADQRLDFDIVAYRPDGPGGAPGTLLGRQPVAAADIPGSSNGGREGSNCRFYDYDVSALGLRLGTEPLLVGFEFNPRRHAAPVGHAAVLVGVDADAALHEGWYFEPGALRWLPIHESASLKNLGYRALMIRGRATR